MLRQHRSSLPDRPDTIAGALASATRELSVRHETGRLDAEVLLAHAVGRSRSYLYAHGDAPLSPLAGRRFARLVARRVEGWPVAYLCGRREFWSLDLEVSPSTLIPRPETELLVSTALARLSARGASRVADLGTGCGAVAIAIASERPDCEVTATDRSTSAVELARRNAERLVPGRVRFAVGDWCEALDGHRYEMIVSNPPYVAEGDPHLCEGDVVYEPLEALVAGPEGLDALQAIARGARAALGPDGWLLLEHGARQGPALRAILAAQGYRQVTTGRDLAGLERVTAARAAIVAPT
jgi:release factor glutamine methyltransferase